MTEHTASIRWQLGEGDFGKGHYSRAHTWTFDGGLVVPASPSPAVVRPPYSDPAGIDPEEAFVASISSCHMLTFLYLAHRAGLSVERYEDDATGSMAKNERGVPWVDRVVLRPRVDFADPPSPGQVAALHHAAHLECFISCSVKSEITIEPQATVPQG